MLGHPLGASGAQQIAGVIPALTEGYVHPTTNYEIPDPECDLDYVPNVGRKQKVKAALCNSIAFGAKNSAVVIKAFRPSGTNRG
jgi:3-oxoacyl-(acyl-carrier-protein) synthase